jgi:hypothetical protein
VLDGVLAEDGGAKVGTFDFAYADADNTTSGTQMAGTLKCRQRPPNCR